MGMRAGRQAVQRMKAGLLGKHTSDFGFLADAQVLEGQLLDAPIARALTTRQRFGRPRALGFRV